MGILMNTETTKSHELTTHLTKQQKLKLDNYSQQHLKHVSDTPMALQCLHIVKPLKSLH